MPGGIVDAERRTVPSAEPEKPLVPSPESMGRPRVHDAGHRPGGEYSWGMDLMMEAAAASVAHGRDGAIPRRLIARLAAATLALGLLLVLAPALVSADPGDIGLQGPSFQGASGSPSGSKPESKLWYNDGYWWASMWDIGTSRFAIWRQDPTTQAWSRTSADIDTRTNSRSDILWDGTKLYIASYQFSEGTGAGASRLLRYSYNTGTDSYSLDSGYPATINSVRLEALTIAKDSTGQLWATWETGDQIWVNRSTTADNVWGTPFALPGAAAVDSDDISTIVAFGGDRIGVMWSNQDASADYFAVHLDSAADTTWGPVEGAYVGTDVADDHLNLKADASGRVYAAVKTSLNSSSQPLIVLLVRQTNGTWSNHTVSLGSAPTRPIVQIDEANGLLRVFYTNSSSGGSINMKTSPISAISFPGGAGTVVALDFDNLDLNNVTSTKQNTTSETGLVIMATNDSNRLYWFANVLGGGPPPVDTTPPVRTGMTIIGSTLTVTYNEPLDPASTPATGAYAASVNGSARGVNSVVVGGSTVTLTLATPVVSTDNVTLAYVAPVTGPIQDVAGNDAAGFAALAVTNGTPAGDTTAPVRTGMTVNGSSLVLSYNEALDPASTPATGAFAASVNGGARGVNSVVVSGTTVTLTLATPVVSTDSVTLAYTAGVSPVQDAAGNDAVSFGATAVTNATPGGGTGGTFTFGPTDDSQVKSNSATVNYGNDTSMRLREDPGTGTTYRSYVKFNVTGLTGTVASVKLRLWVSDNSTNTAFVHGTTTAWTEGTLNWNNAPAFGATALGSAVPATTGAWVEITLSPTSIGGNGIYAFGVKSNGTTSAIFNTSEAATNRPELVVTTSGGPPPGDTTAPVVGAKSVNGASLVINYNEALDPSSEPNNNAFTVSATSGARTVSNIVISGSTVTLTLDSAVLSSDTVTVAYALSGAPIQDVAGNDAVAFGAAAVTNNTPPPGDTTAPVAGAKSVNGASLVINYNEALDPSSEPNNNAFTVSATSGARTVSNIVISGSTVTLTLDSAVLSSDTVTVAYALSGAPIQDVAGNDAVAFGAAAVTNNTPGGGGGTVTFSASEDSQVKSNSLNTNYGNDTSIRLREDVAGGTTYRSYVKFNVTGLSGTVTSVKLRLWVSDNSNNTAFVHSTPTTWTEGTLTWSNAPTFGATSLGSAVPATTGAWVEITLTPSAISGNGTFSLGLKSNGTTSAIFNSSEAATNRPELVVTTSP